MDFRYPVDISETGVKVVARLADLPDCAAEGESVNAALERLIPVLEAALVRIMLNTRPIPLPSSAKGRPLVAPGAVLSAKAALYLAMGQAKISIAELARRLKVAETEARRILDPRHNSKIARLESALLTFGLRMEVSFSRLPPSAGR